MLILSTDVGSETLTEIGNMIDTHGDRCISFLEQKFDVLILGDKSQIEVYQLPAEEE